MKRAIFIFSLIFLIFLSGKVISQPAISGTVETISPRGMFDVVYDKYGNQYSLANLNKSLGRALGGPFTVNAIPTASCSSGYFNLFFEPNSLWISNAAMQTVLCQVCSDISSFLPSSLTNTVVNPSGFKINLYCGTIQGALMDASPFYVFPSNPTNPNQGIVDGQIYKAITTGTDPYLNIPITFSNSGQFYHGFVRLNPSTVFSWNTSLTSPPVGILYDAYGTMLHELCHALGFGTLINYDGYSIFGHNNNYFSRYDQFLYDASGNPLLSSSTPSCSNSNIAFTASLSAIAPLTCTTQFGTFVDVTNCSVAAQYSSTNVNVKVYTPDCWEFGSSLGHFEDMCSTSSFTPSNPTSCIPTPTAPGYNNLYFVMSNSAMTTTLNLSCNYKRYLKEEERKVFCDLGYSVNSFYFSPPSVIDGTNNAHSYSSGSCSPASFIIGNNDGLLNNSYTYTTTGTSVSIPTASLLSNDIPSSGLTVSCVEVVYTNTITNVTATVSGSNLVVTATAGSGLALIKYLPKNSSGQYGNATYVFVYFISSGCNPVNACNMVQNGGFENLISNTLSPQCGILGIDLPVGAISCWEPLDGNPSVITRSCSANSVYNLGVNTIGSSPNIINSFNGNGFGNDRVIGLNWQYTTTSTQAIKNNLGSPLVPGSVYRLSFMVNNSPSSTTGNNTVNSPVVITVASSPTFAFLYSPPYPPVASGNIEVIAQFTIPASTTWSQVVQNFTFSPSVSINHSALIIGINPVSTALQGYLTASTSVWCYLDEISLISQPSPSFAIQTQTICGNQSYTNLAQYASVTGTFAGPAVTLSGGQYHFNLNSTVPPGNYPIAFTYTSGGCSNTIYQMITINTNTNLLVLNPANLCMPSPTLNLSTLLTNTNYIAGTTFAINNSTVNTTQTFSAPGIYTVSAVNSATSLCNATIPTVAVTVYSVPSTPSILNGTTSVGSTDLCVNNVFSVIASSSGTIFTWQPGNLNGSSQNFSPTVTTIYTLSAYNHSACSATTTLAINVFTNCCHSNSVIIPAFTQTAISSSYFPTGPFLISSDFTVHSGGYFIMSGEYYFTNNGKITVESGGDLLIDGAHLYACATDLWKGIVVKNGGHVKAQNSIGSDNLIEDALTAIDVSSHTTSTVNPIMEISSTTFNKNYIDINIANYPLSSSTYSNPFWISGCIFSCRNFTSNSTSWPQTGISGSGLRTAGNPTTGLAAPYLLQSAAIVNLKNPYSNQPSHIAIQISTVGVTSSTAMYGATIGSTANAAYFNLFDAHGRFISASNSNVTSANNVFQNTQTYSVSGGSTFSGTAIYHTTTNTMSTLCDLSATNTSIGNRFWDCHRAIDGNNIYRLWITNAIFRSTQNSANYTSTSFFPGNSGLFLNTNRFDYYVAFSEFTNIQTAIHVPIIAGPLATPPCSICPAYGIYANRVRVDNNTFAAGTGTNTYMNTAVLVNGANNNAWFIPTSGATPSAQGVVMTNNTLTDVNRGLYLNGNGAGFPSRMESNVLTLKDYTVSQHGIEVTNTYGKNIVTNNVLSAPTATNTNQALYFFSINSGIASPSVSCNTATICNRGFEFNSINGTTTPSLCTYWRGNKMGNLSVGIALTNTGVIGPQGSSTNPSDNQWLGSWTGNYGAYTYSSNALMSKITTKTGTPWAVPTPTGVGGISSQWWSGPGAIITTTLGDYHCGDFSTNRAVSSQTFSSTEAFYISNTSLYRYLYFNDSLKNANSGLLAFYTSLKDSSYDLFMQVEDKLYNGYINDARSLNNSISTANTVEANYKTYYGLYANYADNGFAPTNSTDATNLYNLVNVCPANNGGCIYQARALYNLVFRSAFVYDDNCGAGGGTRMSHFNTVNSDVSGKNQWNVDLFPNPATNQITIVSKNETEILNVVIKDLCNRMVLTDVLKTSNFIANLDLNLLNGVYLITITNNNNENVTKKLVIAK